MTLSGGIGRLLRGRRVALILASWFCIALPAQAAELSGRAEAQAGDRLTIAGRIVLLYGALAPQPQQRCFDKSLPWWCGKSSREHLERLVKDRQVICVERGRSGEGHMLATCRVRDVDLAEAQITAGLAKADPKSGTAYLMSERAAREAQTGLWHGNGEGTFVP